MAPVRSVWGYTPSFPTFCPDEVPVSILLEGNIAGDNEGKAARALASKSYSVHSPSSAISEDSDGFPMQIRAVELNDFCEYFSLSATHLPFLVFLLSSFFCDWVTCWYHLGSQLLIYSWPFLSFISGRHRHDDEEGQRINSFLAFSHPSLYSPSCYYSSVILHLLYGIIYYCTDLDCAILYCTVLYSSLGQASPYFSHMFTMRINSTISSWVSFFLACTIEQQIIQRLFKYWFLECLGIIAYYVPVDVYKW